MPSYNLTPVLIFVCLFWGTVVILTGHIWLCIQKFVLAVHMEDNMGYQGLNPGQLHAKKMLYPLYYHSGPHLY